MPTAPNLYAQTSEDSPKPEPGAETASRVIRQYWREIERYAKTVNQWQDDGRMIERLYLDEDRDENRQQRRMAILWSNIETLKPAVYGKLPAVVCSRRYKDRDPTGRTAAEVLERATNTMLEFAKAHETFSMCRDDRLLPGRGTAWIRYEAEIGQYPNEKPENKGDAAENEAAPAERLESEYVCVDYVHWEDFGHNVARTWKDVWLVWRCVYKTKDEVAERFGQEIANSLSYTVKAPGAGYNSQASNEADDDHARIYEIWDKRRNTASWLCEDMRQQFLDSGEPPLDFRDFFPCPEPVYATKSSRKLVPRPDYVFYRDQVKEINDLTDKIHNMTGWLIIKGFVPGSPSKITDPIAKAVADSGNKELITEIESWTEWTERGGAGRLIDWLPLDMIIKAITAAIEARNQLIQDIFQITGLSDIIRGESDPNETLGAQTIKAQTSSRRISTTKNEMARFCRDCAHLVAEVIAEKFEPENIAKLTGFTYVPPPPPMAGMGMPNLIRLPAPAGAPPVLPPPPQGMAAPMMPGMGAPMPGQPAGEGARGLTASAAPPAGASDPALVFGPEVIQLLRDDEMRSFRIEIETDSTVAADIAMDQQRRTQFVDSVGLYLEKVGAAMQESPSLGEIAKELLMFAMRGFHVGRQMEDVVERAFEQMKQEAQQKQANPAPDPNIAKVQGQLQIAQQKAQSDMAMKAADGQREQQNHVMQMQQNAQKFQMEMAQQQQSFMMEMRKVAAELQSMFLEMQAKMADRQQQQAQTAAMT